MAARKTIDHPVVGHLTLDCDVLIVAADDLRIMLYTAEPGTGDAERLALAIVVCTSKWRKRIRPRSVFAEGTQSLVE